MGFYAKNFIYDGIISSEYGLRITSDDSETVGSTRSEIISQNIYRRPKSFLLGVSNNEPLEMFVKLLVPDQLSALEDSVISRWLFGRMSYKKLQILQPDMQYLYYNCIFVEKQPIRYGNILRGYYANIVCDSPYAWEYPRTISYNYGTSTYDINENIVINNTSDNDDYIYPSMIFKTNTLGGYISILNASDSNREFRFDNLGANETITINNDLQIISSSTGQNRLPNFTNYNWMRYVREKNILTIRGNIESISFTHQFAKKVS